MYEYVFYLCGAVRAGEGKKRQREDDEQSSAEEISPLKKAKLAKAAAAKAAKAAQLDFWAAYKAKVDNAIQTGAHQCSKLSNPGPKGSLIQFSVSFA